MTDAKTRLTSLFQGNGGAAAGNDALRYVAPKEPARAAPSESQAPAQPNGNGNANGAPPTANSIVYSTTVSLYQYNAGARKYDQMGTAASTVVGCVLLGAGTSYAVLFYTADKTPLCEVPIAAWKPTVQPKQYLNFYDRNVNWSARFGSEDALCAFMKHVFLVRMHVEIWRTPRALDASSLLKEDLGSAAIQRTKGQETEDAAARVNAGDTVGVEFQCWRVVGNAACPPQDVVTKYAPFEQTKAGELRKFRIGDGAERIKALEEGVVGMPRGGKRMILAAPGKTNGQDWYLLEVTLIKTKTASSRPSASTHKERRSSTGSASSSSSPSPEAQAAPTRSKSRRKTANTSDLVPYDEDAVAAQARDELELEKLKLRQREVEFEIQQRAFESVRQGITSPASATPVSYPQYAGGPLSGFSPMQSMVSQSPQSMLSAPGRPMDTMLLELHAKVDYLIRMSPGGNGVAAGALGGASVDVQSVLRGVERLAAENDRLLQQINAQNQDYSSYEKRCEAYRTQAQRLQDEKRQLEEKNQTLSSQQLSTSADIANLTSERDAAITQTNRLHAEYQQLLAAYYQQQQSSSEADEQRNALAFEQQARQRLERDLVKETKARAIVEQQLQLLKKQYEVVAKINAEGESQRQSMQQQISALQAKTGEDIEARLRQVAKEHEQQLAQLKESIQHNCDLEKQAVQAQLEETQAKLQEALDQQAQLQAALDSAQSRAEPKGNNEALGLADEEKRIYTEQIDLLQQQVQQLEADQYAQVEKDLALRRLSTVDQEGNMPCTRCAALEDQLSQLQAANQQGNAHEEASILLKESVNELYFRFQDVFEDGEGPLERPYVVSVVRKVLKQSTKELLQRLEEPKISVESKVEVSKAQEQVATSPSMRMEVPSVPLAESNVANEASDDEPPLPPDADDSSAIDGLMFGAASAEPTSIPTAEARAVTTHDVAAKLSKQAEDDDDSDDGEFDD